MFNRLALRSLAFGFVLISGATAPAAAVTAEEDLKTIADNGEIVIGVREAAMPFAFLDKDGAASGYTIAICKKVADNLRKVLGKPDLRIRYNHMIAVTRAMLVREKVIDMDCGATSHTAAREQQFDFSLSFGVEQAQLVSLAGANYKSLDDLSGKKLLVTDGSTTHDLLKAKKAAGQLKAELVPVRTSTRAYYALKDGKGDAYLGNADMFRGELLRRGGRVADFAMNAVDTPVEPLAVMMHKNRPGLKRIVDETITEMAKSGELRALYATWFEQPIPGQGFRLAAPPTPEWLAVLANPRDRPAQ